MAKMKAPANGVAVRMYRQGHGDCFLLALPREGGGDPVYVLIDCGRKGGSQDFINGVEAPGKEIDETVKHIAESTDNHLDLVVITHEHDDHLNGFGTTKNPKFKDFTIDEAWFAWTEDPADPVANELRARHHDQLLLLVEARNRLANDVGEKDLTVAGLDSLLGLEFGVETGASDSAPFLAADNDPNKSYNKQAMKLVKDKANEERGIRYLKPEDPPKKIRGSANIRAFVLGPPRNPDLIADETPVGSEKFFGADSNLRGLSFFSAARLKPEDRRSPFPEHFALSFKQATHRNFFRDHYGHTNDAQKEEAQAGGDQARAAQPNADQEKAPAQEVADNAHWRRIDKDWLYTAEYLALKLNEGINNTSLVLAFELPKSKKILFFAGDAQRGNWISWDDNTWQDGDQEITARDILSRAVLYKVGHHGSHNATLNGQESSNYPNLAWMGKNRAAEEFTAMITAVNVWAEARKPDPWHHPLPEIKEALVAKARGRVFQTDTPALVKPTDVQESEWQAFLARATFDEMYFEYHILDEKDDEDTEDDGDSC